MGLTAFHVSNLGHRLAYRGTPGQAGGPVFVWLTGFHSDMQGGKVLALEAWARARGHGFLAFDYSGHGQSEGEFAAGTVSAWRADALAMVDDLTRGPVCLVGSSMGAWISLLVAEARPGRVGAMVLLAPAPDFTEDLMWARFEPEVKRQIETAGVWQRPSDYGGAYPITRALIDDGRNWLRLGGPIRFEGPVRILQGQADADVPWSHALRLVEALSGPDVVFTLIKDGDHRLSRPEDIARLVATCEEIAAGWGGAAQPDAG